MNFSHSHQHLGASLQHTALSKYRCLKPSERGAQISPRCDPCASAKELDSVLYVAFTLINWLHFEKSCCNEMSVVMRIDPSHK